MTPVDALIVICSLTVFGLAIWFVPAYRRHRGKTTVTCPETNSPATVEVNAIRFAATSLRDHPALRLKDCSRWPERADCGQACLSQIEPAPLAG